MSFAHGTYTAYGKYKCRCETCRTYQVERNRRNRARRLTAADLRHGLRASYDAGCRCDECKQARREAYQRLEVGVS